MDLVCDQGLISTFIRIVLEVDTIFLERSQTNYYLTEPVFHDLVSFF